MAAGSTQEGQKTPRQACRQVSPQPACCVHLSWEWAQEWSGGEGGSKTCRSSRASRPPPPQPRVPRAQPRTTCSSSGLSRPLLPQRGPTGRRPQLPSESLTRGPSGGPQSPRKRWRYPEPSTSLRQSLTRGRRCLLEENTDPSGFYRRRVTGPSALAGEEVQHPTCLSATQGSAHHEGSQPDSEGQPPSHASWLRLNYLSLARLITDLGTTRRETQKARFRLSREPQLEAS